MHTIESFIKGKYNDPLLCEDRIVITDQLVAVIDGATAQGNMLWDGHKSGKFASITLGNFIIDHSSSLSEGSAQSCFEVLTEHVSNMISERVSNKRLDIKDYPRASIIIYNNAKKEVWCYGDCQCIIGRTMFATTKSVDILSTSLRSFILERALLLGASIDTLINKDPGRDMIKQILETQFYFENLQIQFGYPVINGYNYEPQMVVTHSVKPDEEVILSTDGYPKLCPTLKESEAVLQEYLRDDPLCFRENPSTKGLQAGMISYDDRAYWRGRAT